MFLLVDIDSIWSHTSNDMMTLTLVLDIEKIMDILTMRIIITYYYN